MTDTTPKTDHNVTICLNMIVRDESKIITRLFDSIISIIDSYCICDTGSEDNTIEIIKTYFEEKNISGRIFEHPFKNFGYNRTYAFKEAQKIDSTYILLLDADMILMISQDFDKQKLTKSVYTVRQGASGLAYFNPRLIRSEVETTVKGPTHEYYDFPQYVEKQKLTTLIIDDINDGGHKENKFTRDIRLLLGGIEEEPNNDRYHFYLANSYHDTQQFEKSSEMYKKRIELGGWPQEVWYSYYRLGLCYMHMNRMDSAIITWLDGYNYYPKRAEALYEIVKHYRVTGKHLLAYHFFKLASSIPFPKDDILFVHTNVYEFLLDYEFSLIHYYIQRFEKTPPVQPISMRLMNILPCNLFYNMLSNLRFYIQPLTSRKQMKISFSSNKTIENHQYTSSNISIVPYQEGYLLNIQFNRNRSRNIEQKIQGVDIVHEKVYVDDDFLTIETVPIQKNKTSEEILGINNVNLFLLDNKVLYSGSQYSIVDSLNNVVESTPCFGFYAKHTKNRENLSKTLITQSLMDIRTVQSRAPSNNLINYALFESAKEVHFVYSWYPLLIGTVHNKTNTTPNYEYDPKEKNYTVNSEYNKNIEHIHVNTTDDKKESPTIFKLIESSTNGYSYGDEVWFVANFMAVTGAHTHSQKPMQTYHFFIVLDRTKQTLLRYSYPFTFENMQLEQCSGLIIEEKQVVLSYSILEKGSYIATYDIHSIKEKLCWGEWI